MSPSRGPAAGDQSPFLITAVDTGSPRSCRGRPLLSREVASNNGGEMLGSNHSAGVGRPRSMQLWAWVRRQRCDRSPSFPVVLHRAAAVGRFAVTSGWGSDVVLTWLPRGLGGPTGVGEVTSPPDGTQCPLGSVKDETGCDVQQPRPLSFSWRRVNHLQ